LVSSRAKSRCLLIQGMGNTLQLCLLQQSQILPTNCVRQILPEANELHYRYYREYGLAIEGLVRHHKVNALEYNSKVDDALPLEDVIKPNPELRKLIQDIDTSKVRLWLFTNAYITHGKRVVKLLGIDDLFEGITYCDYGSDKFFCKPHVEMYDKVMAEAGIKSNEKCYFVGE
jgi:pyrimidine and pyridine-specific 5'-nucleotidase